MIPLKDVPSVAQIRLNRRKLVRASDSQFLGNPHLILVDMCIVKETRQNASLVAGMDR